MSTIRDPNLLALCLDFANSREGPGTEKLRAASDVVDWAERAGAVTVETARDCRTALAADRTGAERLIAEALSLRQAVCGIALSLTEGEAPPARWLGLLKTEARRVIAGAELAPAATGYDFDFSGGAPDVALLGPVVRSALDLLRFGEFARVKRCPNCGWLFYDQSKNHSRRWCDMSSCGNASKVRRHRSRKADRQAL